MLTRHKQAASARCDEQRNSDEIGKGRSAPEDPSKTEQVPARDEAGADNVTPEHWTVAHAEAGSKEKEHVVENITGPQNLR